MSYFEYVEPGTVGEACRILKENGEARVLAGGASLLVMQKNGLIRPSHLVNLKTIPGLDAIEKDGDTLRIGALARHRDILFSPVVGEFCPVLRDAASKIATPPIRNMGTIGGNICHADPAADFPPALVALGAKVKCVSDKGERVIPIEAFFVDYYETSLAPAEIVTEIRVPVLSARSAGAYHTLDQVTNSTALVSAAAVLGLDGDGVCTYAGVGLGGVGATPLQVARAGELLVGRRIGEADIDRVAAEAAAVCDPTGSLYASAEYRREMVSVLTGRALRDALARIRGKDGL